MKILITAGPTREKIDPVRFVSNSSSGKMGYALAGAASKKGHNVTLISGPVALIPPKSIKTVQVESAAEMARAVRRFAKSADMIIMAAAVADYAPAKFEKDKIKKKQAELSIKFRKTEDILSSLGKHKRKGQVLVGFAAETSDLVRNAELKLNTKNLDWIVANEVGKKDRGFSSDDNAATLISRHGKRVEFPLQSKSSLAVKILNSVCASK
ncbi:MAG: bifunctional phosphopantothenoylcysteine decarboxylase/phosphopantothenate--cysteine ligase CoaBC [Lentisphaerae bacterium]|nr:bifunctional phosphopantothenoylcysteine decarboxylase/phosphopantothenate--cysteine ligase CoaBC [Lentisphaerota bacterium]